jgi:hypothetical protein
MGKDSHRYPVRTLPGIADSDCAYVQLGSVFCLCKFWTGNRLQALQDRPGFRRRRDIPIRIWGIEEE